MCPLSRCSCKTRMTDWTAWAFYPTAIFTAFSLIVSTLAVLDLRSNNALFNDYQPSTPTDYFFISYLDRSACRRSRGACAVYIWSSTLGQRIARFFSYFRETFDNVGTNRAGDQLEGIANQKVRYPLSRDKSAFKSLPWCTRVFV